MSDFNGALVSWFVGILNIMFCRSLCVTTRYSTVLIFLSIGKTSSDWQFRFYILQVSPDTFDLPIINSVIDIIIIIIHLFYWCRVMRLRIATQYYLFIIPLTKGQLPWKQKKRQMCERKYLMPTISLGVVGCGKLKLNQRQDQSC